MQLNNITPTPPKTFADMTVGSCFVLLRAKDKVLILTALPTQDNPGVYGIVELGPNGVIVYPEIPANSLQPEDLVVPIEIHSVNFSEKKD